MSSIWIKHYSFNFLSPSCSQTSSSTILTHLPFFRMPVMLESDKCFMKWRSTAHRARQWHQLWSINTVEYSFVSIALSPEDAYLYFMSSLKLFISLELLQHLMKIYNNTCNNRYEEQLISTCCFIISVKHILWHIIVIL